MKNQFFFHEDYVSIQLKKLGSTPQLFAKVDIADFGVVAAVRNWWYPIRAINISADAYYAAHSAGGNIVLMHRLVLSAPAGIHVDHIHHQTLDNRREQIRLATRTANAVNRSRRDTGVDLVGDFWNVTICYRGTLFHLGSYVNKERALAIRSGAGLLIAQLENDRLRRQLNLRSVVDEIAASLTEAK